MKLYQLTMMCGFGSRRPLYAAVVCGGLGCRCLVGLHPALRNALVN